MNIDEFRTQYPQYSDISDVQLSRSLYDKYYKNQMTFPQFGRSFGVSDPVVEEGAVATFADEYSKGVFRGALNTASGLVGTAEFLIPGRQESLLATKANIQSARDRFNPTHEGAAAWSGRVLGEAIPFMATAMAGGYAGGAAAGALGKSVALGQAIGSGGVAFAVEGDSAYDQAKNTGATETQAQTERVIVGTINAYLESLQIRKLIGFHEAGGTTLKGFVRNIRNKAWNMIGGDVRNFSGEILKLAVTEGLQEAAQEGVSIGIPAAMRGEYPKLEDGSPDYKTILSQIGEVGIGGAFAGTVLGGGGAFISATPDIAAPTFEEAKATADTIKNSGLSEIEKSILLRELDNNLEIFDEGGFKSQAKEVPTPIVIKPEQITKNMAGTYDVDLPPTKKGYIRLYRGQHPTKHKDLFHPKRGVLTDAEIEELGLSQGKGGWFSPWLNYATNYAEAQGEGWEIAYIDVLRTVADKHIAEKAPEGLAEEGEAAEYYFPELREETQKTFRFAPSELTAAEQFRNKFDEVAVDIERMRPEEKEEISRERGKRFEEFRNIRDSVQDPRQKIAIATRAALSGKLKREITPLQEKFSTDSVLAAFDTIATSTLLTDGEQISATKGLVKLLGDEKGAAQIPAKHELALLQKAGLLSKQATAQILKNRELSQRVWDSIKDLSFAPWSLLTSFDMSAGGRQGWKVLFADPKMWLKSVARGYRAFASEKYYNFIELRRKTNPLYPEAIKRGVEETTIDSATRGEEMFASNMIQKIPGIRASARGFITTVNEMRFGWYFKGKELSEGMGLSAADQKTLATIANDITGRGKLPKVLQKLQETSLIFFAPKLTAALVRIPTVDLIPSGKEMKLRKYSPARKMLAGTLVKFLGLTLATLYLLDRDDKDKIDVEWNPLSTDFLKVRHKKTRVDITGGYQPLLRAVVQLAAGKRKSTESGRVYNAERTEIISRFLQSKLSPHAGLAVDLWRGETFLGKKLKLSPAGVSEQVYERLAPLFIQDVTDAIRLQGLGTAGVIAPLAWTGLGVQTYSPTLTQEVRTYKDRLSKQYFGVTWDELGPEAQKALSAYYPDIAVQEAQAKIDREDYSFIGKILEEADQTGRKVMSQLRTNIQQELGKYVLDVGNIGRKVGTDWYLNDSRYKVYQKEITQLFNKYMPKLINSVEYKSLNPQEKRAILQEGIDEIKKYARMKLTTEANYDDLRNREQIKRP